jgi:ankyrin repeat protein
VCRAAPTPAARPSRPRCPRPPPWLTCAAPRRLRSLLADETTDSRALNAEGYTALHAAVQRGEEAAVQVLLEHVDPDVRDRHGMTPLARATQWGQVAIAGVLRERGAQP